MEEQLQEYGLSEKETKVYLACLKRGPSTANRISAATDLRRSTTYDILESLKAKGLVSSFVKDKKYYFQAADPAELLSFMHAREEKLRKILPDLEKIKATVTEKPGVELFEGVKGVLTLLDELYKEKELLLYGSAKKAYEALRHIPEAYATRRAELNIKLRVVFEKSEYAEFRLKKPKVKKVTEMRFLEYMKNFPTVTFIAGNQVGILTLEKEILGVHIINKEISQTQRLIFENLWKQAKP